MSRTFDDMHPPPYIFVNGNGDLKHENEINDFALRGYKVVSAVANPKFSVDGIVLLVLMSR